MTNETYRLSEVTKTYGDGATRVTALDRVTLAIDAGEFVAIVGPSGSGKTTMLQLLGGLDRPSSGSLLFEANDLGSMRDLQLTRLRLEAFGFVFQQFNLIPTLSAQENVEAALAPTGMDASRRHGRVRELLEQVGLVERRNHLPAQLSGGEQQRVAIARALANRPRVLLADEPTGNLDTATGQEVMAILRNLSDQHGQTVILITHDPTIANRAARLIHMRDGRLVAQGGADAPRPAEVT